MDWRAGGCGACCAARTVAFWTDGHPDVSSNVMTRIVGGKEGPKDLVVRMRRARVPAQWYAVLLAPLALVLGVLFFLRIFVSAEFSPNHFWIGILFGVPAGFLEEIRWTGMAFRG